MAAVRRTWRAWRWRELGLMLLAALPCLAGVIVLSLVWERPLDDARFRPIYGLLGVLLLGHVVLSGCRCRGDQLLLPLVTGLAGIGLVLVTRLVPTLGPRQFMWAMIGCSVMVVAAVGPWEVRLLERYKYTAAAGGIALVALTLVLGVDPNGSGARLWLSVAGLSFQPSEILKVLLVIFLAGYL
ncbi:MAG TPA: FtsW/RodA/SpoVE family cell cycle protein, partial [Chloroflexota bacterium]|nr:FtsW/RodA/SpoVE family cell cycle protein [Chloroflexota bacterium]